MMWETQNDVRVNFKELAVLVLEENESLRDHVDCLKISDCCKYFKRLNCKSKKINYKSR